MLTWIYSSVTSSAGILSSIKHLETDKFRHKHVSQDSIRRAPGGRDLRMLVEESCKMSVYPGTCIFLLGNKLLLDK